MSQFDTLFVENDDEFAADERPDVNPIDAALVFAVVGLLLFGVMLYAVGR